MYLKNFSNHELVQRFEKLVRTERKITHLVLCHIAEIEDRQIYAEIGFDGMYTYLTRGLGYSEGSAYRRLQSARLLKKLPQVAEKIATGALNLTQLTQVQKCLKEDLRSGKRVSEAKTQEILESLEYKNSFETQKTLAVQFNQPIQVQENLKPQADESVRIEVTLSKEQFQELETARNLLSHTCPEGSWADVLAMLAKKFNQKKLGKSPDVVSAVTAGSGSDSDSRSTSRNSNNIYSFSKNKKSNKSNKSNSKNINRNNNGSNIQHYAKDHGTSDDENSGNGNRSSNIASKSNAGKKTRINSVISTPPVIAAGFSRRRKYISLHKKRALLHKAHHCCEYVDPLSQKRCQSKFHLEIDHIRPMALGGCDDFNNLRILCRTHNGLAARRAGLIHSRPT